MSEKPLGLKNFICRVHAANGPAQLVGFAVWGVVLSGMMYDFCLDCLPAELLLAWGGASVAVLSSGIWGTRELTKRLLLVDMVLSLIVLLVVVTHEPHSSIIQYRVDNAGLFEKSYHSLSEWFEILAITWNLIHSVYLANLIHRQQLELSWMGR